MNFKLTAALLLLSATCVFADGFYAGFAPGSFVVLRESHTAGSRTQTQVNKHVVLDAVPTIAVHPVTQTGGFDEKPAATFIPNEPATPASLRMKVTDVREETVPIAGKLYPCRVTTYGSPVAEITYWTCKDANVPYHELPVDGPDMAVPPHTVKVRHVSRFGTESVTNTYEVISFDAPLKIAPRNGKEVRCVQQRITGEGTMRGHKIAASGLQWLSNQIPGRIAKVQMEITRGPQTVTMLREVQDFGTP